METKIEKEQFWRGHLAKATEFPGSIEKYCASVGVSSHTFGYWRRKFSIEQQGKAPRVQVSGSKSMPARFIPVEVVKKEETSGSALPDPKWLAEFILSLSRGGR
jgi:hypothetical protein